MYYIIRLYSSISKKPLFTGRVWATDKHEAIKKYEEEFKKIGEDHIFNNCTYTISTERSKNK